MVATTKTLDALKSIGLNLYERKIFVRNKMIEAIEGDILAAIFEVSTPSLGTGVEISHAYLRSRLGLKSIPVLALYEKNYWPNKLSTMIKGISKKDVPNFTLKEYEDIRDIDIILKNFFQNILSGPGRI